jgi:hypothetical protein
MTGERVRNLIPFVHVADVARSIAFYELLGLKLKDTYEHGGQLDWAALESDDAQIMLARASAPIERDKQAVLFYLAPSGSTGAPAGADSPDPPPPARQRTRRQQAARCGARRDD